MGKRDHVGVRGHYRSGRWIESYTRSFPSPQFIASKSNSLSFLSIIGVLIKSMLWLMMVAFWVTAGILVVIAVLIIGIFNFFSSK